MISSDLDVDEFDLRVTTTAAPPLNPAMWRRSAAARNDVDAGAELVLLGDSIAASFPSAFVQNAFRVQFMHNFGVSGFRCQHVLWLLESVAVAGLRPASILLMIGTNNLSAGDKPTAIAAGIGSILRQITALWEPRRIVLVQTVPRGPTEEFRRLDRKRLHQFMLGQQQEFPSLLLVDADSVLDQEPRAYHTDRIHLLPFGYACIADLLRKSL